MFEIEVPKGKNWMVTSNDLESKAIFAPGTEFEIISVKKQVNEDILVIGLRVKN